MRTAVYSFQQEGSNVDSIHHSKGIYNYYKSQNPE